ncbi:hypothetical protein NKH18_46370 [Streptomyces sp. M10(2022)]
MSHAHTPHRFDDRGPAGRRNLLGEDLAGATGKVLAERRLNDRLVELTVSSPALGGRSTVALLTPRGWGRRRPGDRWPTL